MMVLNKSQWITKVPVGNMNVYITCIGNLSNHISETYNSKPQMVEVAEQVIRIQPMTTGRHCHP